MKDMKELLNKKILIVDDERELQKTVGDALFAEGFFNLVSAARRLPPCAPSPSRSSCWT